MRQANPAHFILITFLLVTSCNSGISNPSAPTEQIQSPVTALPEITAENMFSFDEMNIAAGFNFPNGFSQGTITVTEVVAKSDEPAAPYEPAYPQHARILLTNSINATERGIRIFRADEINAVDPRIFDSLKAVLAGQIDQRSDFPRLAGAGRLIDAQAAPLSFQNGNGFRFLILKKFDASGLNDTSMTYMYQGLTKDGQYIVSFLSSVNAPFLADLATGQIFTSDEETTNYIKLVNERLNAADPTQFDPPLTALDELCASIVVIQK